MPALRNDLWTRVGAAVLAVGLALLIDGSAPPRAQAVTTPTVSIAQYPLTVAVPAHPQVMFVIPNSQSVDGDLSGAIMTGSGSIGGTIGAGLANSASPVNYTIPSGFTPPLNPGAAGVAPYSVYSGGYWWDNSASRLNVAKEGIEAILNAYMEYADFALMDYSVGGSVMETSAYYMSAPGGFTFTNSPGASPHINNPCYGANVLLTDQYNADCANLLGYYGVGSGIIAQPYMVLGNFPAPYTDTNGHDQRQPADQRRVLRRHHSRVHRLRYGEPGVALPTQLLAGAVRGGRRLRRLFGDSPVAVPVPRDRPTPATCRIHRR